MEYDPYVALLNDTKTTLCGRKIWLSGHEFFIHPSSKTSHQGSDNDLCGIVSGSHDATVITTASKMHFGCTPFNIGRSWRQVSVPRIQHRWK